jgi:hypothetical protein
MINLGIRRNLRKWLLQGNNVYCPCCERHFSAFWFLGNRFNVLCPSCGSLERQDDHVRLYGRDYPQRLMQAGFKVECVDFYSAFSEEEQKRLALNKNDGIIYFCKKTNDYDKSIYYHPILQLQKLSAKMFGFCAITGTFIV